MLSVTFILFATVFIHINIVYGMPNVLTLPNAIHRNQPTPLPIANPDDATTKFAAFGLPQTNYLDFGNMPQSAVFKVDTEVLPVIVCTCVPKDKDDVGLHLTEDGASIVGNIAVSGRIPVYGTVEVNGNVPVDGKASVAQGSSKAPNA